MSHCQSLPSSLSLVSHRLTCGVLRHLGNIGGLQLMSMIVPVRHRWPPVIIPQTIRHVQKKDSKKDPEMAVCPHQEACKMCTFREYTRSCETLGPCCIMTALLPGCKTKCLKHLVGIIYKIMSFLKDLDLKQHLYCNED